FALCFACLGSKRKFQLNRIILSECPSLPVTGSRSATETETGMVTSCCPSCALRPASRRSPPPNCHQERCLFSARACQRKCTRRYRYRQGRVRRSMQRLLSYELTREFHFHS